jgi:hypothetical protein
MNLSASASEDSVSNPRRAAREIGHLTTAPPIEDYWLQRHAGSRAPSKSTTRRGRIMLFKHGVTALV